MTPIVSLDFDDVLNTCRYQVELKNNYVWDALIHNNHQL